MNELVLAKVIQRVLEEQGVATTKGVARIDERFTGPEEKFSELDKIMSDMERRLELATATAGRPKRTSTGSRSATSARSSSQDAAWQPRLIHCRGFAPFGCGTPDKLRKQELADVQDKMLGVADETMRAALTPLGGFALNHKVTFRCDNDFDTRDMANRLGKLPQWKHPRRGGGRARATTGSSTT